MRASRVVSGMVAMIAVIAPVTGTTSARALAQSPGEHQSQAPWRAVEQVFGRTGTQLPGGVFRVAFPRDDLDVRVGSVRVEPAFALGSYAVFMPMASGTDTVMMMGDLALRDDEVPTVMTRLFDRGIAVTALHNHLNEMTPHVMFMHFGAHGEPAGLAAAVRDALGSIYRPAAMREDARTPDRTFDVKAIETVLGRSGAVNPAGILQVSVPRAAKIVVGGHDVPPAMGVATALNFQPTGGGNAAITGDFVLVAPEVVRVARTLREHGIDVTALHNHGLAETPRLFYMHFWAHGDAGRLARGLRAALDQTDSRAPAPAAR